MRLRPSMLDELVPNAAREGQVRERSMQVAQFPATASELNPAEPMIMRRHARPTGDAAADGLDGSARRQGFICPLDALGPIGVRVRFHARLPGTTVSHTKDRTSSSLEVKGKMRKLMCETWPRLRPERS